MCKKNWSAGAYSYIPVYYPDKYFVNCDCSECVAMSKKKLSDSDYVKMEPFTYNGEIGNLRNVWTLMDFEAPYLMERFVERIEDHPEFTEMDILDIMTTEYNLALFYWYRVKKYFIDHPEKFEIDEKEENLPKDIKIANTCRAIQRNIYLKFKHYFATHPEMLKVDEEPLAQPKKFPEISSEEKSTIQIPLENILKVNPVDHQAAASYDDIDDEPEEQQQDEQAEAIMEERIMNLTKDIEMKDKPSKKELSMVKYTLDVLSLRKDKDAKWNEASVLNAANVLINTDFFKNLMLLFDKPIGTAYFHYVKTEEDFSIKVILEHNKKRIIISQNGGEASFKYQLENGKHPDGRIKWRNSTRDDDYKVLEDKVNKQKGRTNVQQQLPKQEIPPRPQFQPQYDQPQVNSNQQYRQQFNNQQYYAPQPTVLRSQNMIPQYNYYVQQPVAQQYQYQQEELDGYERGYMDPATGEFISERPRPLCNMGIPEYSKPNIIMDLSALNTIRR